MKAKSLQEFNIPFVGMQTKQYQFEYLIDGLFFNNFEESNIDNCKVDVKLDFLKRDNFFLLNFYIDGSVEVPCDRCTDLFNQAIFGDYEVLVKFENDVHEDDEDEDVIYISKNDDFINVAKLIYDFILLSIPMRCIHPNDENGNSLCNPQVIKKLEIKTDEESVDPRWAALEKLKNKNK